MLNWPADRLKILSIGTINDVKAPPRWKGKLPMAPSVTRLFMADQSHSALGTAKIITGDLHDRKAIWRRCPPVEGGTSRAASSPAFKKKAARRVFAGYLSLPNRPPPRASKNCSACARYPIAKDIRFARAS
jgi:hypothetical protein